MDALIGLFGGHPVRRDNDIAVTEMQYSLFDAQFENAGREKNRHHQMQLYSSLLSDVQHRPGMESQQRVENEYGAALKELSDKQQRYNQALHFGDSMKTAALEEEIRNAEQRVEHAKAAYNTLQANLSDQQKIQDRIDELAKEQRERHAAAQKSLWSFNFDHASPAKQQQMARNAFFKANNQLEGARTDDEREQALAAMQDHYRRLDKSALEIPAWNGFIRTTSSAVESGSATALELQERVLNDYNTKMLASAKEQTIATKAMKVALEQVVKNTDPMQQTAVGGSAGGYV